jgi:hypothetical protein
MRSLLILIYLALYFVISTGVLFSVHKCRGEVVSISLFTAKAKSCCKKGCEKNGCCKNETHFFKVKEDQKLYSDIHIPDFSLEFITELEYPEFVIEHTGSNYVPSSLPIRPPPISNYKTPLFIKNRVLLI